MADTSDEFSREVNVLVRRLGSRLGKGRPVPSGDTNEAMLHIEDAIMDLIGAHIKLQRQQGIAWLYGNP